MQRTNEVDYLRFFKGRGYGLGFSSWGVHDYYYSKHFIVTMTQCIALKLAASVRTMHALVIPGAIHTLGELVELRGFPLEGGVNEQASCCMRCSML